RLDDSRAQLLAQAADMNLDGVALDLGSIGVELLLKLPLGKKLTRARQKRFEQSPFPGGQLDRLSVSPDAAGREVDVERAVGDDRIRVARIASSDGADPGRQFGKVEWFDEIIVGAGVQPIDAV